MNDDRIFLSKKQALLELLSLEAHHKIIEGYLDITSSTMTNYLSNLKKDYDWQEREDTLEETRAKMFKLLATLKRSKNFLFDKGSLNGEILLNQLNIFLDTDKIIEILDYSSYHIETMFRFDFEKNFPENFQNLLSDVSPNPELSHKGRKLWVSYLRKLAGEDIIPSGNVKEIIDKILRDFVKQSRDNIAPKFSIKICEEIENNFFPGLTPQALKVLRMYYGFDEIRKDCKTISEELKITPTRINQIKQTVKNQLKRFLYSISAVPLTWENSFDLIQSRLKEQAEDYDIDLKKTKHPISHISFSVRTKYILMAADIKYLEDLTKYSESNLKRFRNSGIKTVAEIEREMNEVGLSLKKSEIKN